MIRSFAAALLLGLGLVSVAKADPNLPANCTEDLDADCLYQLEFPLFADDDIELGALPLTRTDSSRNNYQLPILVRFPKTALNEAAPVVIFNHGGRPRSNGRDANGNVGRLLARAGYVVIHPSRKLPASANGHRQECRDNGVTGRSPRVFDRNCRNFIAHSIYGPENTDFLLQPGELAAIQAEIANAGFQGTIDTANVGVAGHSAGTSIVLANAGARRRFTPGGPLHNQKSLGPDAFLAMAPFGPDNAGFYYSPSWSFGGFDGKRFAFIDSRPLLSITGTGDEGPNVGDTGEEVISEARTFAFRQAQPGDKFLSWNTEDDATHGTMALDDCPVELESYCVANGNLVLAFFDAYLRGKQAAVDWLATDGHQIYTSSDIELHRR